MHPYRKWGFFLTIASVMIVAGATWAVASVADDEGPAAVSKADIYKSGMSLDEVAKAATGVPGEVAPPCPSVEVATQLKAADIDFGPCDVNTSEGRPIIVPGPDEDDSPPREEGVGCPGLLVRSGYELYLPCAKGAEIISVLAAPSNDGRLCSTVTYLASTGSKETTEFLCEGDVPAIGGEVRGPLSLTGDGESHEDGERTAHEH